MKLNSLHDLLVDELRDLYSAENQIIKALPKMAKAASSPDLAAGFEEHLEQTRQHAERLEQIFETLGLSPKGKKCKAIEGHVEEGKELMAEKAEESVMDAGLIAAAQKVEHYEIASYGCVCTWAKRLKLDQVAKLLAQTLNEEKATDEKLTRLAEGMINAQAQAGSTESNGAAGKQAAGRGSRKPAATGKRKG